MGSKYVLSGLSLSFVLVILSLNFVSGNGRHSSDGKQEVSRKTQARYIELLDEIERRYSSLKLPRMSGKVLAHCICLVRLAKELISCLCSTFSASQ